MSEPLRLRVVTFNIHGGRPRAGAANLEATAGILRDLAPDLVGLQEVHRWLPPPYAFQNQPALLRRHLDLHVSFRPSLGLGPVGYGSAILTREQPRQVYRWRLPGGGEPRALLGAELEIQGQRLMLFNTHFGLRAADRLKQAEVLARAVEAADLPVIAVGDWNTVRGNPDLAAIEAAGLTLAAEEDVRTFPCDEPARCLDHIAVSRHFRVERCWAVETDVSDHLPLVADLVLDVRMPVSE